MKRKQADALEFELKIEPSRVHIYGAQTFKTVGSFRKEYQRAKSLGETISCFRYMADNWYAISDSYIESMFKGRVI